MEGEGIMNLPDVARTAILTLICRTIESQKTEPLIKDPMAVVCFEKLMSDVSEEEKAWILQRKKMYEGRGSAEIIANAQRQQIFDDATNLFISSHPSCTVINLGCGFDTRFWRIDNARCTYMEIDLPEVIELKKEMLKNHLDYQLIGCSVLDTSWIDRVTSTGNNNFLLIAEGLFMYLPAKELANLLQVIAQRFTASQLIFDTIPEKYTKRIWKWLVDLRLKAAWDLEVSFLSGIKNPSDIESYGFKVISNVKGSVGPIITASINAAYR
jgi:methyltransferase (TIGR00027 family)